ncbi:MAG: PAS domain S-box protein, partial [Chloroflexota bacterium]
QAFQTLLATPGYSETRQFRGLHKNGSWRWVEATATNLLDAPGVQAIVTNFHDITERKQAEEAQRLLATIVTHSDDAIVSKTLEGMITSWNGAAANLFGYSAEEAIGRHITLIIPPDLRAEEEEIIAKLRKGMRIEHFETVRVTKDGRNVDVSLSISPIKDRQGNIIGAAKIARDITERKRAEERRSMLQAVSDLLASSFDQQIMLREIAGLIVPAVADYCRIAIVDEQQQITDIKINHIDPQQLELVRALYEQYKGRANTLHGVQRILETGKSDLVSTISGPFLEHMRDNPELLRIIHALGLQSYMGTPLIVRDRIIGAITFSSIQPHRHYMPDDLAFAEELASRIALALDNAQLYREVQQARDQLAIILQGVADGIIVYDKNSQIIYANESAAQLTGYASVEDLLTAPPMSTVARYEVIDEQRQPFPRSQLTHLRVLAGEREPEAIIGYTYKVTGQLERWSLVKSRPVNNEQGEVIYVITIVHDITERVQAEHRKDEFISMASHELKTPVTGLKGFTYVLQRRLSKQGDEQSLHYLSRMDAQLDKLTKLISDLLDISRMQTGKLEFLQSPFDLDSLITETVENVQAATSTHHLLLEGKADVQILGDKDRLGQVFINLLTNAIKYSPRAGKVLVHLSRDEEHAIVRIQDFGIGIDVPHQQRIFERFYQVTDPEGKTYPGLGIGLYISKEIVERHHGWIEVNSRKGKGTTFSVILPLLQG